MKLIFGMITQFLAAASLNFTSPEMIKKMIIDERVLLNCMDCSYTQNSSINLYITIHITLLSCYYIFQILYLIDMLYMKICKQIILRCFFFYNNDLNS